MSNSPDPSRRQFIRWTSLAGVTVLAPTVVSCVNGGTTPPKDKDNDNDADGSGGDDKTGSDGGDKPELTPVPKTKPEDWNPIAFNKKRGNEGAIPESYLKDINGPDGEKKHLGKHLPYTIKTEGVPEGSIALMWGDPSLGHAKHPNAGKSDKNPEGHWYNWIRVRKATDEEAEELESKYSAWPQVGDDDNGSFGAEEGEDPAEDSGKNTVYIAKLPDDVKPGDVVRVYAHCLTHGEYVDFLEIPA